VRVSAIPACAWVIQTVGLDGKLVHVQTPSNMKPCLLCTLRCASSTTEHVSKGVVTLFDWMWRSAFARSLHDLDRK
jgi:hypothetical protein